MSKIVVIYYHDIVEAGKGHSYQRIEVNKFEMQMRYLKEHGYKSLLFEDLQNEIPEKAVLVTFDDGFESVYRNAVPIMREYDIQGNIFLPTKYVDEKDEHFMSWETLQELCESKKFSVAGHTHTHVDIRSLDEEKMREEIETSNNLIFQKLGIETKSFCMPYGKYDLQSIWRLRKNSQYQFIYGSFYGHAVKKRLVKFLVPRIGISNEDTLEVFEKKLEGKMNWKGVIQQVRLLIANLKGERIAQYDIE